MSPQIGKLVELAHEQGLQSQDGEWTNAIVYWFDAIMPDEVRSAGKAVGNLDYFDTEETPHTPPGEGFIDRQSKTAISFLLQAKE